MSVSGLTAIIVVLVAGVLVGLAVAHQVPQLGTAGSGVFAFIPEVIAGLLSALAAVADWFSGLFR